MSNDGTSATPFDASALSGHAIIAGYGIPGRAMAEWFEHQHQKFVVIEQNETIVDRCRMGRVPIIYGSVVNPETLRAAGIERATLIALTIPVEAAVLEATSVARKLNPDIRILARVSFVSTGFEAFKRGANEALIGEELTAREFVRLASEAVKIGHPESAGTLK